MATACVQAESAVTPTADAGAGGRDADRETGVGGGIGGEAGSNDAQPEPASLASAQTVAVRLARLLWDAEPEAALIARLDNDRSSSRVAAVAAEMLDDPRARMGLEAWIRWLLRLDDLATETKEAVELLPDVRASMASEAVKLAEYVAFDGDGRIDTLFLAPYTMMDGALGRHYGVDLAPDAAWQPVEFPTHDRVGLLGTAGVLTRYSGRYQPPWPARRYWLLSDTLLCEMLPIAPPAPSVLGTPTVPMRSARQQMIEVTASPDCMACHFAVNPLGFAFVGFDTLGRAVSTDGESPVDPSGALPVGDSSELSFTGQPDLIRQLMDRPETGRCLARRLLSYALDPSPDSGNAEHSRFVRLTPELRASFETAAAEAARTNMIRDLFIAVTRTPSFRAAAE
ncbi:DUF1592 domain-containing protein [Sorangium cellulosum]|nr:DUF1592 domain-containing protein [Sorangium cellulosum]